MDNTVTETCEFCGNPLPPPKGRGRRQILHPECGQIQRSLDWVIGRIGEIEMTEERRIRLRKKMFYVSNSFTQVNSPRDKKGRFIKQEA